jgi:HK97 family phage major capsid protein
MNKTSRELREERKAVSDKITSLTEKVKAENRDFTNEETVEIRSLIDSEKDFTNKIEVALELEKRAASVAGNSNPVVTQSEEKEMRGFSLSKLVREIEKGNITGLERELIDESAKEARDLGLSPKGIYLSNNVLSVKQRAMTVGTTTAGGNFVPTEKIGFFDALYAKTVFNELGITNLSGLSANTDLVGFSVGVASAWATETATITGSDATTAARTLRPKRLYAATDISRNLMIQTNDSIESYILNSIMRSLATKWEQGVIAGATNGPTGILATSDIQNVAIGTHGGAPTLAKILELIEKVQSANADTTNAKFLTNPKVVAKLKQTPIVSGGGVGAMIMSYQNYFTGTPNVIDGYPVSVTSNVPSNLVKGTSGAVCSAIIYGDFSQVVTGQFGGIDISVDATSSANTRANIIGITTTMFVDGAVKTPEALGAILDATTT